MSEQKKLSKLCLAGFILAILPVALYALSRIEFLSFFLGPVEIILSSIVGLILSIAGLVSVRRKGLRGKGFGIAGTVLNSIYVVIIGIVVLIIVGLIGILSERPTDKTIPTFYSDSDIVSVRYYFHEADGYRFEELDEDKLDEFIDILDDMELTTGGAMDYYWGGSYGIEMELEDGTYLTYDGTRLTLNSVPIGDEYPHYEDRLESEYVHVVNYDFWEEVDDYFPSIEENGDHLYTP